MLRISSDRNIFVAASSNAALHIEPPNQRLLDLASGAFDDQEVNQEQRGHSRMPLITWETKSIPGFVSPNHSDLDNMGRALTEAALERLQWDTVKVEKPIEIAWIMPRESSMK